MKNGKFASVVVPCLVALSCLIPSHSAWAKSTESKLKDWIDSGSESLKSGIDQLGNDLNAIQEYLNNYHWKGVIQDQATSGPVTLKHVELNDHSRAVVVKPGERIEGEVKCLINKNETAAFSVYRVVVGIKGEGAQTVLGNELGLGAGKSREQFSLIAPTQPGMYEIRFRVVDALFKDKALHSWKDEAGNEPDGTKTIGIIYVKA